MACIFRLSKKVNHNNLQKRKKWGRFGVIEGGKWQNFGAGFDDLG